MPVTNKTVNKLTVSQSAIVPQVILEILSPQRLIDQHAGATVLNLWKTHLPEFFPDRIGNWEPIDRPVDPNNFAAALDSWKWPFLATKVAPRVNCSIWMRKNPNQQLHSTLIWDFGERLEAQIALLAFLKAASEALRADFACLQVLTAAEIERCRINGTVKALDKKATRFNFLLASKDLQRCIPDLYWATVLGPPYLDMFGEDRVRTAPIFRVDSISQKLVLLQMTSNLSDVVHHYDTFSAARQRARLHLGEDAFFRATAAAGGNHRAPRFFFE